MTDHLRDFPDAVVRPLNLEVRSADDFLADTIALDPGRAIAGHPQDARAVQTTDTTAEQLLLRQGSR